MDFLKTLLVYLTVTMATGVQQGPAPADVPVPTATPVVEAQQGQQQSGLPGLQVDLPDTPAPEMTATPEPEPTMTPNRAYSNVAYGDRGKAVTKLQKRLIELGYLPEGAADGAFGYQTLHAVRAFQENNGLSRDGIAGAATQTRLYEDGDVVPAVTATPEITNTPEPSKAPETDATIAPPETGHAGAPLVLPVPTVNTEEQAPVEGPVPGLIQVTNGVIALGASGSPLAALRLSDGVMVPFYPRVWQNEAGEAVVSLRDMADSITSWTLEIDESDYTLSAAGYAVAMAVSDAGVTCSVDGAEVALEADDILTDGQDLYVTENFLRQALKASAVWDEDESTLMLNVPEKEEAEAKD